MNFFSFENKMYDNENFAKDEASVNTSDKPDVKSLKPYAPHHQASSAKVIAEYSSKDHILSAEELLEHRKHCRAKPGNCPFEKAVDEADEVSPKEIKVTKQEVFNRLAIVLTQLFHMAKNLAKPAIIETKGEEASSKSATIAQDERINKLNEKISMDEGNLSEPNTDAKIVAEIIESGINKMVELAKTKGCLVSMDNNNTKYIVKGPEKKTVDI